MADWRYETTTGGGDSRFGGGERFGSERVRGGPTTPPNKRRRDYDFATVGGEREPPPLYAGRGGGERGFDDRAPRGTWREADPSLRGRDGPHGGLPPPGMGPGAPMMVGGLPDDIIGGHPGRASMDLGMPGRGIPLNGGPPVDLPPEIHLPHDASPTLYIDNLPHDCSRREACHIFRPFIGFKEVRLVHKEVRKGAANETIVLCFVDFADARCAATAMEALQGYRFDESDYSSPNLRIDFARQGPRGFGRDEFRRDDRDFGRSGYRPRR